jgi:hypothetical protein
MHISAIAASTLAAMAVAGAASTVSAAPLKIADEFQAVCVANRTAPSTAISTAMARGYTVLSGPSAVTLGSITTLTKLVEGKKWVVRVEMQSGPSMPNMATTMTLCSVGGYDEGTTGRDALRRWAGVTPFDPDPADTKFLFMESGGRHTPLPSVDDAGIGLALQNGGLYILSVSVNNGLTIAALSRSAPAP